MKIMYDSLKLVDNINSLKPWYYLVKICEDIYTIPIDNWEQYRFSITHQHFITRMIQYLFNNFVDNPQKMSALDYGCNCGWLSLMLAQYGFKSVVGYDVYQKYIDQANFLKDIKQINHLNFHSDIRKIYAAAPFEITFCLGVMNHTENPVEVLAKISECTTKLLVIDLNCFVPPLSQPLNVSQRSTHEASLGCNFNPKFDSSEGYNFEIQFSREAMINILYKSGFFPILEFTTPLSQPTKLKYYQNRFFAIAIKNKDTKFWEKELNLADIYYTSPITTLVTEDFFNWLPELKD